LGLWPRPASAGRGFPSLLVSFAALCRFRVLVGRAMQLESKKNNFFSFFSGYLHLPITAPRINLDIDDFYGPRKAKQDPADPLAPLAPPVEPEDLAVGRSPLP